MARQYSYCGEDAEGRITQRHTMKHYLNNDKGYANTLNISLALSLSPTIPVSQRSTVTLTLTLFTSLFHFSTHLLFTLPLISTSLSTTMPVS